MTRTLRYISLRLKVILLSDLQYRGHLFTQLFETGIALFVALLSISILFNTTSDLNGWRAGELVVLVGIYTIFKGVIGISIQPSMQKLMSDIHTGDLDFTLLRPFDSQMMITFSTIQIWKTLDIVVGVITIAAGLAVVEQFIRWQEFSLFLILLVLGIVLIYSYWLMLAVLAFWLIAIENLTNLFGDLFDTGRWPTAVYTKWLRTLLTIVVPVTLAVSIPAEALLGRLSSNQIWLLVGLSIGSLILSRFVWFLGLRSYSGASA